MIWLFAACSWHHVQNGLVTVEGNRLALEPNPSKKYVIHAGADERIISQLAGCHIRTESFRVLNHVWLKDWKVTAAEDGSAPLLGVLQREGLQFYISDINSGSRIWLENAPGLSESVGYVVLVVGIVFGPHRVKPIYFKRLVLP